MSPSRDERSLSLRLNASGFLLGLGTAAILYLIPVFLEELGASYTEIGFIGGIRAAPYAFLPAVAGYLADRLDKARLYLLSAIFAALGAAFLYPAQSLLEAAAANLLLGLHMVFYWPVAESIIAEALPEAVRWGAYARFSVAWSIAYFIGPLVGGVLADLFGLRLLFLLGAVAAASAAPVIISIGQLKPERRAKAGGQRLSTLLRVWPLYANVFIFTIGLACILVLAPSYLSELGWSTAGIGALFTAFGIARALAYLLMSRSGRLPATPLLLITALMQASALILLSLGNPITLLLSMVLAGATNGLYFTACFDIVSRAVPPGSKGLAIGLYEAVLGIGFIAGPVASGPTMDLMGAAETFQALALLALLSAPFAFILGRRMRRNRGSR